MSATNATTYYELPIFVGTDKPAWLVDWNGAMNAIDSAIKQAKTAGDNAQTTANGAVTDLGTLSTSVSTISGNLTTLTTTVNGHTGSINTINSLIGNGEPTTTDKTLIGAINEIYAMIGGGTELLAENVVYDNTNSGLTADDVQSAIDEIQTTIGNIPDFNFSSTGAITLSAHSGVSGTIPEWANKCRFALNAVKDIGKIYGEVAINSISVTTTTEGYYDIVDLSGFTVKAPTEEYYVYVGDCINTDSSVISLGQSAYLHVKTDGSVSVSLYLGSNSTITHNRVTVQLTPCIYFFTDYGD